MVWPLSGRKCPIISELYKVSGKWTHYWIPCVGLDNDIEKKPQISRRKSWSIPTAHASFGLNSSLQAVRFQNYFGNQVAGKIIFYQGRNGNFNTDESRVSFGSQWSDLALKSAKNGLVISLLTYKNNMGIRKMPGVSLFFFAYPAWRPGKARQSGKDLMTRWPDDEYRKMPSFYHILSRFLPWNWCNCGYKINYGYPGMMPVPYFLCLLGQKRQNGRPKRLNYQFAKPNSFLFSYTYCSQSRRINSNFCFFNISWFVKKFLKVLILLIRRYSILLKFFNFIEKL